MSLELPILRVGHAGFSLEQLELIRGAAARELSTGLTWDLSEVGEADALLLNGPRAHTLPDGTLRVAPGMPAARSVHLALHELGRPIAMGLPLGTHCPPGTITFDPADEKSVQAALRQLAQALAPLVAQFCVASQILQQDSAIGAGIYHVTAPHGDLLAVVNLRGDVGVLPSAYPPDIDAATWTPQPRDASPAIPSHLVRCSLSELMWAYALRTTRETLPPRYMAGPIYFRRPPRLPQRLLGDSHLLLLRELAHAPASFGQLGQRTGLDGSQLAQDLGALYLVGAITANPKRASQGGLRHGPDSTSHMPSGLRDSSPDTLRPVADLTAPAPLSF